MLLGEIVVIAGCALGAAGLAAWTAPRWLAAAHRAWHAWQAEIAPAVDGSHHTEEEDQ